MGILKEEEILNVLKKNKEGLTIQEVAKKAGMHRVTASKYLSILEAKNEVKCRKIGNAKLYTIKTRFNR